MNLNERKTKILEAIIKDYISTAEPIGSRTIAKKYDWGLSSATIRNEMSDLEEMGFIIQPHASAGRVPSDKGYRLYVDRLMRSRELTDEESDYLQEIVFKNINKIDYLMRETAKAISYLTNYTAIVSEARPKSAVLKHIQLVPIDDTSILLVSVNDLKAVSNHVIGVDKAPDADALVALSAVLNRHLQGVSANPDREALTVLSRDFGVYRPLLGPILDAVFGAPATDEDTRLYTSGIKNLLAFPEFSDISKAREIFQTLEESSAIISMLGGEAADGEDMQVIIGSENDIIHLQNCSLIRAGYKLGGRTPGTIAIIGPTRMDYSQVISVLNGIVYKINNVLKQIEGG